MMLDAAQKREPTTTDGRISDRKFNTIRTLFLLFFLSVSMQKTQEEYREKLWDDKCLLARVLFLSVRRVRKDVKRFLFLLLPRRKRQRNEENGNNINSGCAHCHHLARGMHKLYKYISSMRRLKSHIHTTTLLENAYKPRSFVGSILLRALSEWRSFSRCSRNLLHVFICQTT